MRAADQAIVRIKAECRRTLEAEWPDMHPLCPGIVDQYRPRMRLQKLHAHPAGFAIGIAHQPLLAVSLPDAQHDLVAVQCVKTV
ncbi:hypothetical protein D3C78_1551210 [compost metagenome]